MARSTHKCVEVFRVFSLGLVLCVALGSGQDDSKQMARYEKAQRFVLSCKAAQQDPVTGGTNVAHVVKGRLGWVKQDDDGFLVEMRFAEIERKFLEPRPENQAQLLEIDPFTATVSMSQEREVPLSMKITEGKMADGSIGLSLQYRMVYLLFDMMCATSPNKRYRVSEEGRGATFHVTGPNEVDVYDFGKVPAQRMLSSISPKQFTAYPRVSEGHVVGTDLVYFKYGSVTMKLATRLVDNKTGFAKHAINFAATSKVEVKQRTYMDLLGLLSNPLGCEAYHLEELTVVDAD